MSLIAGSGTVLLCYKGTCADCQWTVVLIGMLTNATDEFAMPRKSSIVVAECWTSLRALDYEGTTFFPTLNFRFVLTDLECEYFESNAQVSSTASPSGSNNPPL